MNRNFMQAIRGPIMLIALGTLVAIDYAGVYGFWRTWPILIILFGLLKLLEHSGEKPPASYPGGSSGSYPGGSSGSYPGQHPMDGPPGGNVI
jgi:hypothetical protein